MRSAMLAAMLLTALPARAEQPVDILPGPGQELVQANCDGCHSLDYIRMNAPFLSADGWKAEVTKMRTAFGAPISEEDAAAIVKYLAATYGTAGS
jgi:mono/diheme cytochrome c family protein